MNLEREPIIIPRLMSPNVENPYGYIYITTNLINNKKYVGKHSRPEFDVHYLGSGKILRTAISKYGKENFICEIIDWSQSPEELNQKEKFWINLLEANTDRDFWYNICDGGNGGPIMWGNNNPNYGNHASLSEEHKRKIRENTPRFSGKEHPLYGKHYVMSEDTKRKISISTQVRKISNKTKEVVGSRYRNKNLSEEHKKNISMASKRNWDEFDEDTKQKCLGNLVYNNQNGSNNLRSTKIVQLDLDGNLIKVYSYMSEVEQVGFSRVSVGYCCRGKQKQYKGYKWMYLKDYINQGGTIND